MTIPQTTIDRIKTIPIEDIVTAPCRRTGNRLTCLCPIPDHAERTPSFTIYADTNTWHCFGCGEGGDVISLYQKMNGVSFQTACEALARDFLHEDIRARRTERPQVRTTSQMMDKILSNIKKANLACLKQLEQEYDAIADEIAKADIILTRQKPKPGETPTQEYINAMAAMPKLQADLDEKQRSIDFFANKTAR